MDDPLHLFLIIDRRIFRGSVRLWCKFVWEALCRGVSLISKIFHSVYWPWSFRPLVVRSWLHHHWVLSSWRHLVRWKRVHKIRHRWHTGVIRHSWVILFRLIVESWRSLTTVALIIPWARHRIPWTLRIIPICHVRRIHSRRSSVPCVHTIPRCAAVIRLFILVHPARVRRGTASGWFGHRS